MISICNAAHFISLAKTLLQEDIDAPLQRNRRLQRCVHELLRTKITLRARQPHLIGWAIHRLLDH